MIWAIELSPFRLGQNMSTSLHNASVVIERHLKLGYALVWPTYGAKTASFIHKTFATELNRFLLATFQVDFILCKEQ